MKRNPARSLLALAAFTTLVTMTAPLAVAEEPVDGEPDVRTPDPSRRWEREIRRRMRPAQPRLADRAKLGAVSAGGDLHAVGLRLGSDLPTMTMDAGGGLDLTLDPALDFSLGMLHDPDADPTTAEKPQQGDSDLAGQATNPVASLVQLQIQNNFVGENAAGDGYSNQFVVQPVLPWKIGELQLLSRITLPLLVATPDLGGDIGRKYGVGDLVALNAMVFNIKDGPWKGMYGPIASVTLPTASSDFLGQGKWQAGPGFIYINLANKHLQWGLFGYQQWSFASAGGDDDRPEVSKLFFQPIFTVHFEKGWYVAMQDILWSIDWNDNARWSLPTGPRIGRVMKFGRQPVNIFVLPYYDLSGNNKGNEWGVKLNVTLLFPQ